MPCSRCRQRFSSVACSPPRSSTPASPGFPPLSVPPCPRPRRRSLTRPRNIAVLRILHVVPTYLPATRYGGPIVSVHGLCRALARRGHDVHVFTTNVDGDSTSDVPLVVGTKLHEVSVHYFASSYRRLYYSSAMRRALRDDARAYDIVHLHSVFLWPTYAAARAARKAGVSYVVSPRGMLVPELIERKSGMLKRAWIRLFEKRTFAKAAAVHFTSQREHEDARLTGIPVPK